MAKKIYYIGGSPCSGKSTIAERISKDYNAYYFKADDFLFEVMSLAVEKGLPICTNVGKMSADQIWMRSPLVQCEEEFLIYEEIAEYIFEKLNFVQADVIIAEGAVFTPNIMKRTNNGNYICIVPSPNFQVSHYRQREWIWYVLKDCTDKETAFDNWMQRDILFANQVSKTCGDNGIPCIVNDGKMSIDELYKAVKEFLGIGDA